MNIYAIVDAIGRDPTTSDDLFMTVEEAEKALENRLDSCDLIRIEIKSSAHWLLVRSSNRLSYREPATIEFVCRCVHQTHTKRELCDLCHTWAGGPPNGEEE